MKRALALFNEGRFDESAALMAEDIRWYPRVGLVETPVLEGRKRVVEIWQEQSRMFGGPGKFAMEALTIEELGGGVVLAEIRASGEGSASGISVNQEFVMVTTFRNRVPVRVDSYATRDEALAALDLG
jgi:ketosteroid isomerase-like protein